MQYYLVAFKDRLSKLDVEVEVFFDLENCDYDLTQVEDLALEQFDKALEDPISYFEGLV